MKNIASPKHLMMPSSRFNRLIMSNDLAQKRTVTIFEGFSEIKDTGCVMSMLRTVLKDT